MSEERELLVAVLSRPDADAPRLVYADRLDTTGRSIDKARAELIRIQIALETLAEQAPNWPTLMERERELLGDHQAEWERPLRARLAPGLANPGGWLAAKLFGRGGYWVFRRGFPEVVSTSVELFLSNEARLLREMPVRTVSLSQASLTHPALLETDLSGLRALHLISDVDIDKEMEVLVGSARSVGMTVLEMRLPDLRRHWDGIASLLRMSNDDDLRSSHLLNMAFWESATPVEQERIRTLFAAPGALRLLDRSTALSETELFERTEEVYLGDLPRRAGLWAVARSFTDLADADKRVRRLLLFRPGVHAADALDALKAHRCFHADLTDGD